ncbi:MAG TPA: hypothetical protein VGC96_07115 [Candidatus Elarobacter sp.]|jgi:hypothetical protein
MIVRRVLSGVILAGLAAPLLAAAPHPAAPRNPKDAIPTPPHGMTTRVFARADAQPEPDASPNPDATPSPPVATAPSPDVAARARAELEANRSGKIDRTHYTPELNARITEKILADAAGTLRSLGAVKTFTQVRKITQGSLTLYVFRIEFEKPPVVEEAIAWNQAGKVDFLQFGPVTR